MKLQLASRDSTGYALSRPIFPSSTFEKGKGDLELIADYALLLRLFLFFFSFFQLKKPR